MNLDFIANKNMTKTSSFAKLMHRKLAFTMAEILLSLTVIGVVAAITLPALMGNINDRAWATQKKALHARLAQSVAMMPQLSGFGTYTYTTTESGETSATADTAAYAFITDGLSKVLKLNHICEPGKLQKCGITDTITNAVGSAIAMPTDLKTLNAGFASVIYSGYINPQATINTKAAAFETGNGESVALYYNPSCLSKRDDAVWHYSFPYMCANFIYDLNGTKGPNQVGKDIGFVTALYSYEPNVVAPDFMTSDAGSGNFEKAEALCDNEANNTRLPNIDELSALFWNANLYGIPIGSGYFWSGSVIDKDRAWGQSFNTGRRFPYDRTYGRSVRCVRR